MLSIKDEIKRKWRWEADSKMEAKSTEPERGTREDAYTSDNLSRFKFPSVGKIRGHLVHGNFADREHCVRIKYSTFRPLFLISKKRNFH